MKTPKFGHLGVTNPAFTIRFSQACFQLLMISANIYYSIDKNRKLIYDILIDINKIPVNKHKGGPW